jgi:hypothetical protein
MWETFSDRRTGNFLGIRSGWKFPAPWSRAVTRLLNAKQVNLWMIQNLFRNIAATSAVSENTWTESRTWNWLFWRFPPYEFLSVDSDIFQIFCLALLTIFNNLWHNAIVSWITWWVNISYIFIYWVNENPVAHISMNQSHMLFWLAVGWAFGVLFPEGTGIFLLLALSNPLYSLPNG